MKKLFILAAAISLGTAMTSCKKDYTCVCNRTYTENGTTVTRHEQDYTFKDSKVRAADKCNQLETTGSTFGTNYTIECDIK